MDVIDLLGTVIVFLVPPAFRLAAGEVFDRLTRRKDDE